VSKPVVKFNQDSPEQMRLPRLALCLLLLGGAYADKAGLYPPGLLPLINRANTLLSTGHFNEAAKVYSEAIGMINSLVASWNRA